ncbi:MAG: restriction endonuclease [Verrucomicrobia bacterium]|nr:restriction endonuclease [Verrucomicrobiota bacterium]
MPRGKGSEFTRFFRPIVEALKEKGGSGTTSEVIDRAIEILGLSEAEQNRELGSGSSRVRNQAQWARLYLARGGLLDSSARGIWRLTETGTQTDLATFDFQALFKDVQKQFHAQRKEEEKEKEESGPEEAEESAVDYRIGVLRILRALSPDGFERLCQRLLRESGFEQVVVTGRSGDGGIDGLGILQVNPFVSFNVLFQCKRYSGGVTPSQIRDFRGAMQGRADKGIIMTTGTFTVEAKREARRDGAPPIELVDGDDLVRLFENLELGLRPRKTYDLDEAFFNEFK